MKKIFVISKNKTTNLGNVALTSELQKLYQKNLGGESLIFSGRPEGLNLVSYDAFISASNHKQLFGKWLKKSQNYVKSVKPLWDTNYSRNKVTVVEVNSNSIKHNSGIAGLKKIIKKLFFSKISKTYEKRFSVISAADLVVYSGAGEVGDDTVFLRQLLELALVQSMGIKTCAINQSVNLREPKIIDICRDVYNKMECIVVRGLHSKEKLIEWGVREELIFVCPDTAVLTEPSHFENTTNAIGINFTPFTRYSSEAMKDLITYLRNLKYEIFFVSNNYYGDQKIIDFFIKEFSVQPITVSNDYREFSASLSRFKYIISSRLHTNVLSLCAHVPVIPVEGHFYKTIEMFNLFEYPIPVIDKNLEGWEFKMLDKVKVMERDYQSIKDLIKIKLPEWRKYAGGNCEIIKEQVLSGVK